MLDPGLGAGAVRVWWAAEAPLIEVAEGLLDARDRARAARMPSPRARAHRAAWTLLRLALGETRPGQAASFRFATDRLGAPRILAPAGTGLRVSLAHAGGHVACAVALERPVGVDLEPLTREVDALALARRFFAPEEALELAKLEPAARQRRFLAWWTAKEAYAKCQGRGLAGGALRARISGAGPLLRMHPPGDRGATWSLRSQIVGGALQLAVVAAGLPAALVIQAWPGQPGLRGPLATRAHPG